MTYRRISALLLAAVIGSAALASCGDSPSKATGEASAATAAEAAVTEAETELDSLEARALVSDDVPELDFNGKEFRIFYQKRYTTDAVPFDDQAAELVDEKQGIPLFNLFQRFIDPHDLRTEAG